MCAPLPSHIFIKMIIYKVQCDVMEYSYNGEWIKLGGFLFAVLELELRASNILGRHWPLNCVLRVMKRVVQLVTANNCPIEQIFLFSYVPTLDRPTSFRRLTVFCQTGEWHPFMEFRQGCCQVFCSTLSTFFPWDRIAHQAWILAGRQQASAVFLYSTGVKGVFGSTQCYYMSSGDSNSDP